MPHKSVCTCSYNSQLISCLHTTCIEALMHGCGLPCHPPQHIRQFIWPLFAEPLPPPTEVQLREVNTNNLIFTWNTVQTDCPTFRYAIRSDCGTCASNSDLQTTQPTVSCSFEQPGTLDNFCSLSVTSLICRNISGSTSVSAGVNLRGKLFPKQS